MQKDTFLGFFCMVIGLRYVTDLLDLCNSLTHRIASSQVERCNFMLGAFMKLALEGKDHTDRTLYHLLNVPTNDGGQWQMLVNLIEKYGVIPNEQWPSTWMANNSRRLGGILDNQVREHSKCRPAHSAARWTNYVYREQRVCNEETCLSKKATVVSLSFFPNHWEMFRPST